MLSLASRSHRSIQATWFGGALEGEASVLVAAAQTLASMLGSDDREPALARIRELKQSGHDRRVAIEARLAGTFITPFSRHVIQDLASGIVDALDRLAILGNALYTSGDLGDALESAELVALLVQACEAIRIGIVELDDSSRRRAHVEDVQRMEDIGHALALEATQRLIASAADVRLVLAGLEVYRGIESSLRAAGRVGRTLGRLARS